ncbi:hypothetical protein BJ944DRAFT_113708 [Cunninghamella echinulata]|nr:hypothetical protein BJ944DRAFT_113708 [Cunninghamella echinulata]
MTPSSPISDSSDIKSKHFLSRFLSPSTSTASYHLHTPPSTPPPPNQPYEQAMDSFFDSSTKPVQKIKKRKRIKKLFKKLTKSGIDHDHQQNLTNYQENHMSLHYTTNNNDTNNIKTTTVTSLSTTCSSTSSSTAHQLKTLTISDRLSLNDDTYDQLQQRQRSSTFTSTNTQPDSIYSSCTGTTTGDTINIEKHSLPSPHSQSLYNPSIQNTNHNYNNTISDSSHIKQQDTIKNNENQNDDDQNDDDDDDDDDDINQSSDDESFVDAEEEINLKNEEKRSSLSHLLGAGHFNSAGGLAVNIHPSLSAYRNYSSIQKLRRSLPPDELTQPMLDWKRKSTDGNNRFSGIFYLPENDTTTTKKQSQQQQPNIIINNDDGIEENNDEENELSKEDKEASRAQAENKLICNTLDQKKKNQSPPSRGQHERSRSIKALSEMFSKSLDDAWNQSSTTKMEQLQDPRLSHIWIRPSHLSVESKETAKRIWDEDESFMSKDKFAEWLGQTDSFNAETLVCYMDLFYFTNMQLDSAFRKLCSKLYFKAEAQQIDRILEVFAHRYWDCNPQSIFKCADVVYAVVYSILLLNTDLHVVQGNHQRMTKIEFVKNTMVAINTQRIQNLDVDYSDHFEIEMENYLKEIYISVKNYQILQPLSGSNANSLNKSNLRHVESLKRGMNSIIRRAGRESVLLENDLLSIQKLPTSTSISSTSSSSLSPSQPLFSGRRQSRSISIRQNPLGSSAMKLNNNNDSITSFGSGHSFGDNNNNNTNNNSDHHYNNMQRKRTKSILRSTATSLSLSSTSSSIYGSTTSYSSFIQNPPYAKEGIIMCKHLLKSSDQKARFREWNEYLVVAHQGFVKLYTIPTQSEIDRICQDTNDLLRPVNKQSSSKKVFESPLTSFNPAWKNHLAVTIELNHTLANVLPPPGYNKNRPHVFALQQANGGVYLFQGHSLDDITSWVDTCNYWAAMKSKEPLQGGVSNMDFGWGECLHDVIVDLDAIQNGEMTTGNTVGIHNPDAITIFDWQPPLPPMTSSHLNEQDQLNVLKEHLHWLHAEINEHREVKTKILVKFPKKSFNYKKVMANWSLKSSYLLGDILKYQHYCDAIEKGLLLHTIDGEENKKKLDIGIDFEKNKIDLIKEIELELNL